MPMHTTNYVNTFISVADDCPVTGAEIPADRGISKSIAKLQFEMIRDHPYEFTSDDVLFHIYALRNGIALPERRAARDLFFSKGQACFRASPLPKRYGWGVHSDAEGKIALYPMDSEEYRQLLTDPGLKQVKAMRSKRS